MLRALDAQVTAAAFDATGAVFATGDGRVVFESGEEAQAHDGAVLSAVAHPSGDGLVTGGDDGRVAWTRRGEAAVLYEAAGQWIDAVAAAPTTGLIGFCHGKTAGVLDAADPAFRRTFSHERTVADVAFDPKGRRLAAATYGGVDLWYARLSEQKATRLKWPGAHTRVVWSPDGAFVVTAMHENQLHGWRLKDARDMRMGGYPAKIRSLAFFAGGSLLATAGANGVVLWSFVGSNGPMGKEASEIGYDDASLVVAVAARAAHGRLVAGTSDGRVWAADPAGQGLGFLKAEKGPGVAALALSPDAGRVAWADDEGNVGVADVPALG